MEFLTKKNLLQKIIIVMLITLILIFSIAPNYSSVYAAESDPDQGGAIGTLLKEILNLIVQLGDIVMSALNNFMLGARGFGSAMLKEDNPNLDNPDSWLYVDTEAEDFNENDVIKYTEEEINTANIFSFMVGEQFEIPNMLYSPENIFANNIAALDVNFLRPNTYTPIVDESDTAQSAAESAASGTLRSTIATWYKSFRNIAIVGLLSVLVYLGIRILISSTSVDKAKYKESLQDWLVALCLVFVIHFLMSGILMLTDRFTDLFGQTIDDGIIIEARADTNEPVYFRTNLMGYARFSAQSSTVSTTATFSIIYMALVIYTCVFTFMYFKRFLYMAFFTMIAPLVALTYPIDRAGDGKAQAFNIWFKEYTMNAILQPVHLILYVALVSSAMELVEQNMIYALVAIGFLKKKKKFIKKMFGFDKADTTSGFGSFAGGALAMSGIKQVASLLGRGKPKAGDGESGSDNGSAPNAPKIRTQDRGLLGAFAGNNGNDDDNNPNTGMVGITGTQDDIDLNQEGNDSNGDNEPDKFDPVKQAKKESLEEQIAEGLINPDDLSDDDKVLLGLDRNNGQTQDDVPKPEDMQQTEQKDQSQQSENIRTNDKLKPQKGWRTRRIKRAAKSLGKKAFKGAKLTARGLGIATGATVGLAAGVASGDFSKTLTYAGAGVVAGNTIGKAVGNAPEGIAGTFSRRMDVAEQKREERMYNRDKDMYGVAYATQQAANRINEREKDKFMRNKEQKARYEEMAGRIAQETKNYNIKAEDLMAASFDYQKAGITDEKQIETGLTMEAKNGGINGDNHEKMIDIVNLTKDYGKDYVIDDKKRNSMQELIKANVSGERNQNDVWNFYTEALGMKEMGRRHAINPPRGRGRPRRG